jgi:predicted dehydrogenase
MVRAAIVGLGRWGRALVGATRGGTSLRFRRAVGRDPDARRAFALERRALAPVNGLRFELEAFARAVRTGAPFPIPAEEMIATVAAFEAIVQSAASARAVSLEPWPPLQTGRIACLG